ncbi:MAG: shikimate dehydrogenase [Bifidobacterium tibiigranuli]|jgi:shikimate dehydrogenase|nr:shikimate dehydrogenase [Bifidobacterium tibiigranuli]
MNRADHADRAEQSAPKRRCAVLGKPIAHSLSPVLHNAAYRALNLDGWEYSREEVGEEEFEGFLTSLDGTWAGLSLTMPLKKTVMAYGTPQDQWSRELGLANTAVFRSESGVHDASHVAAYSTVANSTAPHNMTAHSVILHNGAVRDIALYNTDVDGIVLAFRHAWETTAAGSLPSNGRPSNVVILGNGNTALSALAACVVMTTGARITVVARHPDANPGITRFVERHADAVTVQRLAMEGDDLDTAVERMSNADIVISTLPAHAADGIAQLVHTKLAADTVHGAVHGAVHGTLLDVAYDPRPSALQRAWSQAGGTAIGGEEMLLYQAIVQVCLMTGRDASRYRVAERATRAAGCRDASGDSPAGQDVAAGDMDDVRLEQTMRDALQEAW